MRPHLLELEAFGAFPGRVRLDLDDLSQGGLLLLCGDTGGGKTTLLDALGFALYGVVPGERSKAKDALRSHHAAADVAAWVRLEFTARGRRLRVTRRPLQERPKARGTGVVLANPTALLEQRDGDAWVPVAQRPDDVGLEVGRLLGMDAGQFFQVVVLPQGRFAAFLQAKHAEREALLKKLFHVDRFEHAEAQLADRAAEATRRLEAARAELAVVAARVEQEAGVESPDDLEAAPEWVLELATGAEDEAGRRAATMERRAHDRREAERALAGQLELARRQQARADAERELRDLEQAQPEVDALETELTAARRALPVQLAAATARRAAQQHGQAETAEQRARAALDIPTVPAAGLRPRAAELQVESGRLEGLRDVLDRAQAAETARAAAASSVARLTGRVEALTQQVEVDLPAQQQALAVRLSAARTAERELPQLQADRARLAAGQDLADRLARLEAERPAALRRVQDAEAAELVARDRAQELRDQRFDAITAELAGRLTDDSPCPVCGSVEHPEVFEVQADHVSKEAEQAAEQAADAARRDTAAAVQALGLLDQRRTDLLERLAETPADAVAAAGLDVRLAELEQQAADVTTAEAAVAALQRTLQEAATELAGCRAELVEAGRREHEQDDVAQELRTRLDRELGDVDLPRRQAEVAALAQAYEEAAEAAATAVAAGLAAAEAERACREQATAAGFATPDDAVRAARDSGWQERAQARLDVHTRALAAVRGRLAGADLAVALQPPASVSACEAQLAHAVAVHEEAVADLRLASERAAALARLVPAWSTASAALPALREDAARRKGLAELVAGRGDNRLSMPLSTFVLAGRLEEVAGAASLRLERMSGGRYTLVHSDAGNDKRSRAGLGLQVEDGWTGRRRDTATLSGGETFMTALALALGLADVVTAESGGHSIDALFVDEGFGTLDAHSLDQVMDVLDELRSGGRLVGVVSHVADLRQRIPAQVRVLKGSRGSSVA